jgi:hypothetical protein
MRTTKKSLKNEKIVHGITVKRLPIGAYIEAVEAAAQMPAMMADKIGLGAFSLLARMGKDDLLSVVGKALSVLPNEIVLFFARLVDADPDSIKENLTPMEFAEVVAAFWEINQLGNFIVQVKALVMSAR